MKVCVIYKKSVFQKYIQSRRNPHLAKMFHSRHPLTTRFREAHSHHSRTLDQVQKILKAEKVSFRVENRHQIGSLDGFDLIITVGGDGTFLKASHFVKDHVILGVNSAPTASVGALLSCTLDGFRARLNAFLNGKGKIKKLNRLAISLNGKCLPDRVLNEALISHASPAGVSRYRLNVGAKEEVQRSSGVWIATAAGSTAAIYAAGGKRMPLGSERLQYFVREPLRVDNRPYSLLKGFVEPYDSLKIVNQTIEAVLFLDGTQTWYNLKFGDKLVFKNSEHPLKTLR